MLAVVNVEEYADKLKFVPENLTLNVENSADVTENINTNYKDVYAQNIEEQVKFYKAIKLLASVFAYGFIAIITLIGITNIFNTLTSNIELRQKEYNDSDEDPELSDAEEIYDEGRSQGRFEAYHRAIEIVEKGGIN